MSRHMTFNLFSYKITFDEKLKTLFCSMNGKLLLTNVYQNTFLENIGWHSTFYCKSCGKIPTNKKKNHSIWPQTRSKLCKITILLLFLSVLFLRCLQGKKYMVNSKLYFEVDLVKVTRACHHLKIITCFTNVDWKWLIVWAGKVRV